ncbi:hypothetical protein V496_05211 [Pseudogymnoascus sp. VKM F-4515 (FW-2607)]|nr:hypothetical protein V496_05211 [Pseudogymnoascus sp. VKM F-4515 (FW-2607)]
MLIVESHIDVPTKADGVEGSMRIFLFHPSIPGYPNAKFPGVALFSEIYQVTGPVARFARSIASAGYIVAAPSSYHDFVPSTPLTYDVPGTDLGNSLKAKKTLESYDADSAATIDALLALPTCTGRLGATGMCLGGHLAIRCALDPRISAAVAYFATDVHSATLGANNPDDTLARFSEIKGELASRKLIKQEPDLADSDDAKDDVKKKDYDGWKLAKDKNVRSASLLNAVIVKLVLSPFGFYHRWDSVTVGILPPGIPPNMRDYKFDMVIYSDIVSMRQLHWAPTFKYSKIRFSHYTRKI